MGRLARSILIVSVFMVSGISPLWAASGTVASWPGQSWTASGVPYNSGVATLSTNTSGPFASSSGDPLNMYNMFISTGWNGGAGTKYWQVSFKTTGMTDLKISSKQMSTDLEFYGWDGPRDFKLQYSTDGSSWSDVPGATLTLSGSWSAGGQLNNVSLPSTLNNKSTTVYLRWIMTTNTAVGSEFFGSEAQSQIRDIIITGTETPMTPTDIDLSNMTIDTSYPADAQVGTITSVDSNYFETYTYSLVSGTGSSDNAKFYIVDNRLYLMSQLTAGDYHIRLNVYDGTYNYAEEFTINVTGFDATLPRTGGDTSYNDYITNVTFAGINKTSDIPSSPPLAGYLDYTATKGTAMQGTSGSLSCTINLGDVGYPAIVVVWFDWNHDSDFDDAGEKFIVGQNLNTLGSNTCLTTINVPADAVIGDTRMRVMSNANLGTDEPVNSGSTVFYGQCEDYTVTVTASSYTISGNAGVSGATLSYTDGTSKTATADGSGNYSFTVANNWSGTVTPSKNGYFFSPVNKTYSSVTANQTSQNYTATAITYTISGNAGKAGATLSYTDGTSKTATADGSGNYSFTVSYNWSGTVTPSYTGYTFSPVNRTYTNVLADQTSQDYTATINTYTISGSLGGNGANATVTYTGGSATADGSGNYSFTIDYGWTGTITPSKTNYSFTPVSITVSTPVTGNLTNQDFSATLNGYTISGTVTDGTNPIAGATVTFSHNGHTETTDASGNYSYLVNAGTTTTVTPSHAGYHGWSPASITLTNVTNDQEDQDFTGIINTYTISGTVTDGTNPLQGITVTFSHNSHTETTDANGNYSYTVNYGTTTTVTPSSVQYGSWSPANYSITSIAADQSAKNFSGSINTYTISGTVTDGTDPVSGVTITFSHNSHTETTDASGNYSYSVPYGTTTTVTPSHTAYASWSPASVTLTAVTATQSNKNFTGTIKTYTVSGTVTDGSSPLQGVTITFSHNSHKETTDASGNYSYTVPYGTTTSITPSHAGYHGWSPTSTTLTTITANQTAKNFSGIINTYTISGTVTDGSNSLQGVTVTFSHNGHTETTDASGNYSYSVNYGTTTTITPSSAAYSDWSPASRTLTAIGANQTSQNFSGSINQYTIGGTITDGTDPVPGVTVTFSHNGHTETTDASGNYTYSVPYGTTTTVTPNHAGYHGWSPTSTTLTTVTANQTAKNFSGIINTYTISGTVTDGSNPLQDVTITFSHNGHTETTDASGNYSYSVNYGTTTTITPSSAAYSDWSPASRTLTAIGANQTSQNFSGSINQYTIGGTITDGTDPIPGVTVTFSHNGHTETTDASGVYEYAVLYGTTTIVTPSHAGYHGWSPATVTVTSATDNHYTTNFTGTINTYTLSGCITADSSPVPGVTVTFSHNGHTETTDSDGRFSYIVPYYTTTTITPSKAGTYNWNVASRTVTNVTASNSSLDFTCSIYTYTVSGTITDGTNPLSGISVTFSHNGHAETTNSSGSYSYIVQYGTTTTVTPSHTIYGNWSPSFRTLTNITADVSSQNFNGEIFTHTITVTPGTHGSISPVTGMVTHGSDKTYTITPNAGYKISDVRVDNISVGQVPSYTFENIVTDHTISAVFTLDTLDLAMVVVANNLHPRSVRVQVTTGATSLDPQDYFLRVLGDLVIHPLFPMVAESNLLISTDELDSKEFVDGNYTVELVYKGTVICQRRFVVRKSEKNATYQFNGIRIVSQKTSGEVVVITDTLRDDLPLGGTGFQLSFADSAQIQLAVDNPYGGFGGLLYFNGNEWECLDSSKPVLLLKEPGDYCLVNDTGRTFIPIITKSSLAQNYPNPFNPSRSATTIEATIAAQSTVIIKIFDMKGRDLKTITEAFLPMGIYRFQWDGKDKFGTMCASGVYYVRMSVNGKNYIKKMVMLK